MKKTDAVFSLLITEIQQISDNTDEVYWGNLDEASQNNFDAICDELSALKNNLEENYISSSTDVDFPKLKSVFQRFNSEFGNYPKFNYPKISFQIAISSKICVLVDEITDEDVDTRFGLLSCSLGFTSEAFISDVTPTENNLAWFNPNAQSSLDILANSKADLEIWYSLASLSASIDSATNTEFVFGSSTCIASKVNAISLLKIYMLARGEKVTKSIEYLSPPKNSSINNYDPRLNYSQFGEVIQILGEYVERRDVLSKYLSIYHVIESFTFKYPIVKLERSRNGVMFSIRDFKSLYKAVEINEIDAVHSLMRVTFDLPFGASTIGQETYTSWTNFIASQAANITNIAAIDEFIVKLGLKRASVNSQASFCKFFSAALYRIRCSIVHNKETEYHISSENYSAGCQLVLEEFYLPSLEEVIFLLLSKENDVVWYKSDSIQLWSHT